ncbi:DUF6151 family protein [Roseisalinus antarcticus]|uniref:CENP-V/GFA domain-containing protein n=1 Tax=Roseisalinus antarcticus TaxID=254357 RepID=A0A1Y5RKF7_9RHOB|nr:DUF6151 family protein [Roseisalinus antarcticus]SLN19624.1 hypothetical protein ROA7023_00471 [Roseisalinus antarcticus]
MGKTIAFACTCGALRGHLVDISPAAGTRALCHCADCRAAEIHASGHDPAPDPVELFQTTPDRLKIDAGAEHLAAFFLRKPSFLRWYANCCGATLFNSPARPTISSLSMQVSRLADAAPLGPVTAEAFVPGAGGKTSHKGLLKFIAAAMMRIAAARISGRWRQTPLFDAKGQPVAVPERLTEAELAALPS